MTPGAWKKKSPKRYDRFNVDCFRLIREVGKRNVLWDESHEFYNNPYHRNEVNAAWEDVASIVKYAAPLCRKKFKYFKDRYRKEIRVELKMGRKFRSGWSYYDEMGFLKKHFLASQAQWAEDTGGKCSDFDDVDSINAQHLVEVEIDESEDSWAGNSLQTDSAVEMEEPQIAAPLKKRRMTVAASKNIYKNLERTIGIPEAACSSSPPPSPKPQTSQLSPPSSDSHLDHDSEQFFNSLLPFMRHFPPIQKLRVRTNIQTLILREMEHVVNNQAAAASTPQRANNRRVNAEDDPSDCFIMDIVKVDNTI